MLQNIISEIEAEQAEEEKATAAVEKENPQESELEEGSRKQDWRTPTKIETQQGINIRRPIAHHRTGADDWFGRGERE